MNGLDSDYTESQIKFIRIDANSSDGAAIQRSYALRGHPSIALIDADGVAVQKFVGEQSAEILRESIDMLIASDS